MTPKQVSESFPRTIRAIGGQPVPVTSGKLRWVMAYTGKSGPPRAACGFLIRNDIQSEEENRMYRLVALAVFWRWPMDWRIHSDAGEIARRLAGGDE